MLSGRKLWATNGTIADIAVVMAKVPKSEGHRGGISAFVVRYDSEGITVEHRNAFMGLRGIENSVTRLDNVFVPEENRIAREGDGLKIALSTLNTGRLALMASAVGAAKWATKIAREWSTERVQWGRPIGKHDAVAQKVAFIAGSAFGLEAMLDVAGRLADNKANDVRIEAALCKVYGSELAWRVIDELLQVRGGRGYETAASLKARGEKPVPVEQMMRDMRVNRIFEGSSEIMHLLIAREAVDQHLQAAGDLLTPGGDLKTKADAALKAGVFYSKWLPQLAVGKGQNPRSYDEFGPLAGYLRYVERSSRKLARSTFYGMGRWQAKLEQKQSFLGAHRRHRRRAVRDRRSRVLRRHDRARASRAQDARHSSSPSCSASRPNAAPTRSSTSCGPTTTTPITPPPSACWPAATPGWRTVSPTHRATGR